MLAKVTLTDLEVQGDAAKAALAHTLVHHKQIALRVRDLELAMTALQVPPEAGHNDYDMNPKYYIGVCHGVADLNVKVNVASEILRPLIEAELARQTVSLETLNRQLLAAHESIQALVEA